MHFHPNSTDDQAAGWTTALHSSTPLTEADRHSLHKWLERPNNASALRSYHTLIAMISELPSEKVAFLADHAHLLPGYKLESTARFLLPRAVFKRYVEPVIADMQHEYRAALSAGHPGHARWIAIRGHLLIIPGWLYAFFSTRLMELLRRGQ